MKHCIFILLLFLLYACEKNIEDIKLIDYLNQDSVLINERIAKEKNFGTVDVLRKAVMRYSKDHALDSIRDKTIGWLLVDQQAYQKKLESRQEIYDVAIRELKDYLKFPNTAKLPELKIDNYPSLEIIKDTARQNDEYYKVVIYYEAQNSFGNYIPGKYTSFIKRDSTGKLIQWLYLSF